MVITGWPGTGKTLIGIALAREMVRQGMRVLVLTFNNRLADYLTRQLDFVVAEGMVSTWHKLCAQARRLLRLPSDFGNDAWYQSECANDLRMALKDKLLGTYDVLILDEAQALRPEWYAVLLEWFQEGKVVAFCDETQVFPFENGTTLKELCNLIGVDEPFLLTIALRTPKAVTEHLLEVKPISYQLQCPRPVETDTIQELVVEDDWQTMLNLIKQFKEGGVNADDIIVLSKFQLVDEGKDEIVCLGANHELVSRFRGLESPIVIVLGAEEMDEGMLFCAYSRATTSFVALYEVESLGWQKAKSRFHELVLQESNNRNLAEVARTASLTSNIIRENVDIEWFPLNSIALGWCPAWGTLVAELEDNNGPSLLWLDFLTSHYDWRVYYWDTNTRRSIAYLHPVESILVDTSGRYGLKIKLCKKCGLSPHDSRQCIFCSEEEQIKSQRPISTILDYLKNIDGILTTNHRGKALPEHVSILPLPLAAYRAYRCAVENGSCKLTVELPGGRISYRAALVLIQSLIGYQSPGYRIDTEEFAQRWYDLYSEIKKVMTYPEWKSTVANAVSTCFQRRGLLSKISKGVYETRLVSSTVVEKQLEDVE